MAGSPEWKVFNAAGDYQAACREPAASIVLAQWYGKGSTVRHGHTKRDIVWTEGTDQADNYDHATVIMLCRLQNIIDSHRKGN